MLLGDLGRAASNTIVYISNSLIGDWDQKYGLKLLIGVFFGNRPSWWILDKEKVHFLSALRFVTATSRWNFSYQSCRNENPQFFKVLDWQSQMSRIRQLKRRIIIDSFKDNFFWVCLIFKLYKNYQTTIKQDL